MLGVLPQLRRSEQLKLLLGEGLTTSEGEAWRRQRRFMQPAFHSGRLRRAGGRTRTGTPIDVATEFRSMRLRSNSPVSPTRFVAECGT